jgi:large subunit ribosomal protein L21
MAKTWRDHVAPQDAKLKLGAMFRECRTARPRDYYVMHAVIKTGGKQYRVAANDIIEIEKVPAEVGETVAFPEVLMVSGDGTATIIGTPMIAGALVSAEVVEQTRGDKVIIFKKRRRHNYRRKKGHRQELSFVRITEVLTGGAKPAGAFKLLDASAPGAGFMPAAKLARRGPGGLRLANGKSAVHGNGMPGGVAAGVSFGKSGSMGRPFGLLSAPEGGKGDNLSLISGVGPKMEEALHTHGIFHFWQVAAMTDADVAKLEGELAFAGRVTREEWREQARELMAGKAPRAKVDRDAQAAG